MGMTTRKHQGKLATTVRESFLAHSDVPHYFEVRFKNHPNGLEKIHCGTLKDVERALEINPDATVKQIFPPIPTTVDVPHITIMDQELPLQQSLPQSEAIKLEL